ncbi:hypothetical protein [Streptomyces sp. SID1121]|uniref:hypothetical protein n=1 Tax=Streptomyces sp. SID1121 TaxID=3425888 RepID=UPI004056C09A
MVDHQLVVSGGTGAPVQDLLPGELLEDEPLVVLDIGELRLRNGDDGDRTRRGEHDRRPGPDVIGKLPGCGCGTGLSCGGPLFLGDA